VGCYVEVQYNSDRVEVFYNNERIAAHQRSSNQGRYTTVSDHMPSTHQAFSDWQISDSLEKKTKTELFKQAIERRKPIDLYLNVA